MTIQEFIKSSGMTHKQLSERFGIPKRTIEDWSRGARKCPDYVVGMMQELLNMPNEEEPAMIKYEYEPAYYHYRPEFLATGRKNPERYTFTACDTNGDYWRRFANSKEDILLVMKEISNGGIDLNTLSMQNDLGQLMWSKEIGWHKDHPKYMDDMTCFK